MDTLASLLLSGARVVFVTGAGLSVASGIPPYRSGAPNATWQTFVTDWGTRARFQADPLLWWNRFWLQTHHKPEFLLARPNLGHAALHYLTTRFAPVSVVTQNIDRLQRKAGTPAESLIQVHGALGYYKCVTPGCAGPRDPIDLAPFTMPEDPVPKRSKRDEPAAQLHTVPACPHCDEPVLPQALFFDEDYDSHPFYRYAEVRQWFAAADAIVFVGTSFAVGVTHDAVEAAAARGIPVFNMNVNSDGAPDNAVLIQGAAEQTLPLLAATVDALRAARAATASIAADDAAAARAALAEPSWTQFAMKLRDAPKVLPARRRASPARPGAVGSDAAGNERRMSGRMRTPSRKAAASSPGQAGSAAKRRRG